jgi:hypothetical protein
LLRDDAAPRFFDQVDGLVEVLACGHRIGDGVDLIAQIERDDVRTLLGEPNRVRAALAPRGASDECNLAFELQCHDSPERSTPDHKNQRAHYLLIGDTHDSIWRRGPHNADVAYMLCSAPTAARDQRIFDPRFLEGPAKAH